MKSSCTRDWLIDFAIIMVLAGVAVYALPLLAALFLTVSSHLGRTLFWVHSIALGDLLPHFIVGSLLGLATARFIRHQTLWLALMPAVLFCLVYVLYFCFGSVPYPWGKSWQDFVIVSNWLLLVAAALLCARVVLKHRRPDDTTLQPAAAGPVS
jgi:hypothetical protein